MQFSQKFLEALQDYILFLDKKYPEKAILELVATRYSLNHFERSMLFRGIISREIAERRKLKLVTIEQLNHQILHIDLFNVLFTIAAYLRGFPVYLSADGLLRDASESHGKGDWEVHLDQGLDLLIEYLTGLNISIAFIYLDGPLRYGLAVSEKLRDLSMSKLPPAELITDPSPDHLLREATEGIIATSDSTIIDKSALPVFDLPKFILVQAFQPDFISLDNLITNK